LSSLFIIISQFVQLVSIVTLYSCCCVTMNASSLNNQPSPQRHHAAGHAAAVAQSDTEIEFTHETPRKGQRIKHTESTLKEIEDALMENKKVVWVTVEGEAKKVKLGLWFLDDDAKFGVSLKKNEKSPALPVIPIGNRANIYLRDRLADLMHDHDIAFTDSHGKQRVIDHLLQVFNGPDLELRLQGLAFGEQSPHLESVLYGRGHFATVDMHNDLVQRQDTTELKVRAHDVRLNANDRRFDDNERRFDDNECRIDDNGRRIDDNGRRIDELFALFTPVKKQLEDQGGRTYAVEAIQRAQQEQIDDQGRRLQGQFAEVNGQFANINGQMLQTRNQVTGLQGQVSNMVTGLQGQFSNINGQVSNINGQILQTRNQVAENRASLVELRNTTEATVSGLQNGMSNLQVRMQEKMQEKKNFVGTLVQKAELLGVSDTLRASGTGGLNYLQRKFMENMDYELEMLDNELTRQPWSSRLVVYAGINAFDKPRLKALFCTQPQWKDAGYLYTTKKLQLAKHQALDGERFASRELLEKCDPIILKIKHRLGKYFKDYVEDELKFEEPVIFHRDSVFSVVKHGIEKMPVKTAWGDTWEIPFTVVELDEIVEEN